MLVTSCGVGAGAELWSLRDTPAITTTLQATPEESGPAVSLVVSPGKLSPREASPGQWLTVCLILLDNDKAHGPALYMGRFKVITFKSKLSCLLTTHLAGERSFNERLRHSVQLQRCKKNTHFGHLIVGATVGGLKYSNRFVRERVVTEEA